MDGGEVHCLTTPPALAGTGRSGIPTHPQTPSLLREGEIRLARRSEVKTGVNGMRYLVAPGSHLACYKKDSALDCAINHACIAVFLEML